jgi:glycosyltransferase involved in cell wall biosynthesis
MVCGRSVIVTERVGCAPDLVDDANGRIVPPDDTGALRGALKELLADRERLRAMGNRSAERIQDWSIDVAVDRTTEAVRSTVG